MHLPGANHSLPFVWGPRNVSHTVVDVARLTSSRGHIDLSAVQFTQMGTALRAIGATEVKISAPELMEPELGSSWRNRDQDLVGGIPSDLFPGAPRLLLSAWTSSRPMRLPTIISDLDLLHVLIQHHGPVRTIALKGNEAAGFVSGDTVGVLYSSAKEMLQSSGREVDVVIWAEWLPQRPRRPFWPPAPRV